MNLFLSYVLSYIYLLTLVHLSAGSDLEQDGWANIRLDHCLASCDDMIFTERGNVSIQSLRSGQAVIHQVELSHEQQAQLSSLAAKNKFYQIRAIVTSNDGSKNTFVSSLKACMLAEAELDDRLSVSLDYLGRVIAVSFVVASKSSCEGVTVPLNKLRRFTTNVYVRQSENGPIPDTASYIQKLEREREAKERGEVKDNRSIFAKYWMYIVPVVILLMVSSMTNPEAAAGGAATAR